MKSQAQLDLVQIILDSHFSVQFVLLSLIFFSIYSWSLIFLKRKRLKAHAGDIFSLEEELSKMTKLNDALMFVKSFQDGSPAKNLITEVYNELTALKNSYKLPKLFMNKMKEDSSSVISRFLFQSIESSKMAMNEKLTTLATIGSLTPFIGLFGTVLGIINSFQSMSSQAASLETIAPGIAEALVATAVGLFCAIPAVWYYNRFTKIVHSYESKLYILGQKIVNLIDREINSQMEE